MKVVYYLFVLLIPFLSSSAQEIQISGTASIDQVYGLQVESEKLLPMNDLDMDNGYVLYEASITLDSENALLEVENVRDYAAVYIDDELQGTLTDNRKRIALSVDAGSHILQIYVENIGRITYGPEILDNSKGLFGNIYLDGQEIEGWKISELKIKSCTVPGLNFSEASISTPGFHRATFEGSSLEKEQYLDVSGWGMGEVWINGNYIGSFWEEEKQQSLMIPASILVSGENEVVIFEIKNNKMKTLKTTNSPVFK
jgi:beta-galactosidase